MKFLFFLTFGLLNSIMTLAQWQKVNQVELPGIERFDQDPLGNIYVITRDGNVTKFSAAGEWLLDYSPVRITSVDEIKISTQLKVLLFYEGLQEVVLLNRWLGAPVTYKLSDFGLGFVTAVCPTLQQNIWAIDMTDFSLKLVDPNRGVVLEQKSLAQILHQKTPDIEFFSVQENLMFLGAGDYILVFDVMGNFVRTVDAQEQRFFDDKMYGIRNGLLVVSNLYSGQSDKIQMLDEMSEKILFDGARIVDFTDKGFIVYKYLSNEK